MKKLFTILIFLSILFFSGFSLVQADMIGGPEPISLTNPLGEHETIPDILEAILRYLITYIAPPIFVIMVLVGAMQMLFSVGDTEKFKRGKKTVIYSIIAYVIIIIASVLTTIINNIIN